MDVIAYDDAAAFLAGAGSYLALNETLNSLMLGVVQNIAAANTQRRRFQPLLLTVEAESRPALAAFMNSPHKLLLGGAPECPDEATETLVSYIEQRMPNLPAVFGPNGLAAPFALAWARRSGRAGKLGLSQLLYELGGLNMPSKLPPGCLRPANINDRERLAEWLLAFQIEAMRQPSADLESARFVTDALIARGELYVWQAEPSGSGEPLSMAARARPTANTVAVNFVYTPPQLRGQGFASACVAHLSRYLLDNGWKSVNLFTDRANPTSNHIYERIGYRPVAIFDEYRLL